MDSGPYWPGGRIAPGRIGYSRHPGGGVDSQLILAPARTSPPPSCTACPSGIARSQIRTVCVRASHETPLWANANRCRVVPSSSTRHPCSCARRPVQAAAASWPLGATMPIQTSGLTGDRRAIPVAARSTGPAPGSARGTQAAKNTSTRSCHRTTAFDSRFPCGVGITDVSSDVEAADLRPPVLHPNPVHSPTAACAW